MRRAGREDAGGRKLGCTDHLIPPQPLPAVIRRLSARERAQYGVATVHFYWIGAVPAMVFLGIVMMPFYYEAKVRSVPEYLRLRFNEPTHALNASTFAVATVLIAGVNLFAPALIVHLMLGWSISTAISSPRSS